MIPKRVYHGSIFDFAEVIAEDGALLSPWEREIKALKRHPLSKTFLSRRTGSFEEIALELASVGYSEREIAHRVQCISLTEKINHAAEYAFGSFNKEKQGFVLELDFFGDGTFTENSSTLFVSRRFSLDSLRAIYLASHTFPVYGQHFETLFARFHPQIKEYQEP